MKPASSGGTVSGGDGGRHAEAMLSLNDIRKIYVTGPVTTEILKGVQLDVHRGDLLSIMGPSGCGKSTLMNIIGLLDRPSSGSYRLSGREIGAMRDSELSAVRNASIGFVFQSFYLLPRLTAWENVGVPLVYRGSSPSVIRRRAHEMLDKVGMEARADYRPSALSGGQQQRIAIARALVGEPELILADEPTGALDPDTGREIMQLFRELNADEQVTVVIITHDRGVARQCRRRTHVADGVLHEAAPSDRQ